MITIPIYQPSLTGREKEYVLECIDSTWISSKGKYISLFEKKIAERHKVNHAASTCNGTTALHLALLALGIGPGDEIIVPTLTYIASVNAISYVGATPIFVDSLESNWQIDPDDIKRKITKKTRGIMVVHLYGHPCDMDKIMSIANENGLYVIEDCAEAFGSTFNNKPVGSIGHIGTFSFFGNKTITCGEGGMVVTNDKTLIERVNHLKGQGLAAQRQYWHDAIGYNYRMTNICAAIGLAQLEQSDIFITKKRQIAMLYKIELQNLPIDFHHEDSNVFHTYWMNSILVKNAWDREPLRQHLQNNGIETRPIFYPVHTMPMYNQKSQSHPVAESIGERGINLPSWPGLTHDQIHLICSFIHDFFGVNDAKSV